MALRFRGVRQTPDRHLVDFGAFCGMEQPQSPQGIAPELRSAWRFSLIQQVAIFLTVFAMQDNPLRLRAAAFAAVLFWAVVGFIVFLRRSKPILIDLLFVRWAFPLLWL